MAKNQSVFRKVRLELTLAFAALILVSAPLPVASQQVFGGVYGTVTDSSGAAVKDATVVVTELSKNVTFKTLTNESGNYSKGQLIPGSYFVEVSSAGFKTAKSDSVIVTVDSNSRLDFTLTVGDVSQAIDVTAATPLLQADRADIATNLTAAQILELPNLQRNFVSFLFLTPGVQLIGQANPVSETPQGSFRMSVNGQNFGGTGYQLDGTDDKEPLLGAEIINPNVDAIGEAKFSTEDFDAEFGYVGGGMLTMSTKSGSNQYHGSAFDYILDNTPGFTTFGRNPFTEPRGASAYKSNQFGGSIGGRVIKDKLFFFGDAELVRRRQASTVLTTVPTLAARTGDLSAYPNTVYDPTTGSPATGTGRTPFAGNMIPTHLLSPQALALLNYFPTPNTLTGGVPYTNNYIGGGNIQFDSHQWDTRWDYYLSEKNTFFGRYTHANYSDVTPGAFGLVAGGPGLDPSGFSGVSNAHNQSFSSGFTHTFGPSLINEFRFGFLTYNVHVTPNGYGTEPAAAAGIPGLNLDNTYTSGLPAFNVTGVGGSTLGYSLTVNRCNCPLTEQEKQFEFVDNISKTAGNHEFKFGGDFRYATNLRVPSDAHRSGELQFDPGVTGIANANGAVSGGLGLATFLLGDVDSFTRYVSSSTHAMEQQRRMFWYGQDFWRITKKLTVNYGLRWEWVFPETVNAAGNGGMLDLNTGLIDVYGVGGVSMSGNVRMNWKNFAPRAGIAYQIAPKTVLRAGAGYAFGMGVFGNIFGHVATQNLPVLSTQLDTAPNSFSDVFTLAQGPPAAQFVTPDSSGHIALPNKVAAKVRPDIVTLPVVLAYNATLQQQLTHSVSVSAAYVGNQGRHVINDNANNFNVNQAAFVPGLVNLNLAKPYYAKYGWTQAITYFCDCAVSNYNSFQAKVEARNYRGFTVTGTYDYQAEKGDSGNAYTFLYNRPLGYGNQDLLSHQQVVAAQNFDLPFGHGRAFGNHWNRAVDLLAGGWNLSGVTTFYSGKAFTATIGNYPAGYAQPSVGPAYPDAGALHNRNQWFLGGLGGAFLLPPPNTFGNYGFNDLYGPIFINQDLTLSKAFRLTEHSALTLRADAFNSFNHTNLGLPDSVITDKTAGQITSLAYLSNMRRLQFALRLDF